MCRAVWFPEFRSASNENNEKYGAIVEVDLETGKRYIDIFLAETPNSLFVIDGVEYNNIKDLEFVIDEDIPIDASSTLSSGNYLYKADLGEYGGYKIYFDD